MKKKLPSLARTPSGLSKTVIAAIRKKGETVTGASVLAVIGHNDETGESYDEDDEDLLQAQYFLDAVKSVEPLHVWWVLEKRDIEAAQAAELGIDEEQAKLEAETEQSADDARAYLRSRYIYGVFRDEVWDKRAESWISNKALTNAELHRMPINPFTHAPCDPFDLLRRDGEASRVHNERFVPGNDDEIVTVDKVDWLNTWVAPDVKPVKGTAKKMCDHILYLCNGNKEYAAHILNWLAYCYQNPGKKINHALLVISAYQGVGKDTMALAMARLLGRKNVPFLEDDAISDGRNEFMKRAQMIIVPEIMSGDRRDVSNKLKPLITQPEVRVNEKNVKPYWVENLANFAMFSNHENAAHIEDHDRRYFVIICQSKPMPTAYYDELYEYIESDALSGFAWFLKNRDLSDFNPKAVAPDTEHKDVVRQATKSNWEAFLQDAWDSNAAPFDRDVINLREAVAVFGEIKGAPRISTQQIASFLKNEKIGGGDLGKPRIGPKGTQFRVYAVRGIDELKSAPLDVIQRCYSHSETFARAKMFVDNVEQEAAKRRASK
jgi:hypothetical protein